jgi:hypothetical protein
LLDAVAVGIHLQKVSCNRSSTGTIVSNELSNAVPQATGLVLPFEAFRFVDPHHPVKTCRRGPLEISGTE